MEILGLSLIAIIVVLLMLMIAALPLNLAVKLLGGRSSTLKVIITNLLTAFIVYLIYEFVNHYAGFIAFIATILVYRIAFRLGWIRAFLAWILQAVIALILVLVGVAIITL
jgi:hypothetical protein